MNLASIDSAATRGESWLHKAAPWAKLSAFALVLAAVIVNWNLLVLAAIGLLLAAVVASSRAPAGLAFSLALYPAIFAAIFAVSAAPDVITGAVIILKAVVAALAAVTMMLTTPYPQVFAPLQRLVPAIVGDALLMTYRSTFLLLGKFANLMTAMRLRAGVTAGRPLRTARSTARALAGTLLYSIDLAQRDHDIMRLRGYESRLRVTAVRSASVPVDVALVAVAAGVAAASTASRVWAETLNPYTWIAPAVGALLLVAVITIGRKSR